MLVAPISSDECFLFTASRDRLIKLWHIDYSKKGSLLANLDSHTDWVNQIKLIPEARNTLISCSNDTTIKIWKLDNLHKIKSQQVLKPFTTLDDHTDYVRAIDYGRSGRLYSASDDGEIKLWDLNSEKLLQRYALLDRDHELVSPIAPSVELYN